MTLFCFLPIDFALQAAFRTDLSVLLDHIGAGKESLSFMKRRIRRLAQQWATAANRLDAKLGQRWRDQKKVREGNSGSGDSVDVCVCAVLSSCLFLTYPAEKKLVALSRIVFNMYYLVHI